MTVYAQKLRDPRWQKKRLQIMERDGFACVDCRSKKTTLNVHHCYYYPRGEPWETPDDCLVTVCEDCHMRREETEQVIKITLARKLAKTPEPKLRALVERLGPKEMFDQWGRT
jgi:5-methylcytosine-specific restriction endonuclease McrA